MHKQFFATALLAGAFGIMLAALAVAQNPGADTEPKPLTPHSAGASKEGAEAIKRIRVPKELKVEVCAAEPIPTPSARYRTRGKTSHFVAAGDPLNCAVCQAQNHLVSSIQRAAQLQLLSS